MPNAHWVEYQRWSVFWYSTKKKKWVRKRFAEDVAGAIKFFKERDYPGITLHSDNRAYPPPKRITEHEYHDYRVVLRKGKHYKKKVLKVKNLMGEYNLKGIWWCPYCIQLRRFKLVQSEEGAEMYCPVCTASHRICRVYNPQAAVIDGRRTPRRTSARSRRRRRKAK